MGFTPFSCQLLLKLLHYCSECSTLASSSSCCVVFPHVIQLHEARRACLSLVQQLKCWLLVPIKWDCIRKGANQSIGATFSSHPSLSSLDEWRWGILPGHPPAWFCAPRTSRKGAVGLGFEGLRINAFILLLYGRKWKKGDNNSLRGWYNTSYFFFLLTHRGKMGEN